MSRFIDERGRIFGRVNVVDILVLVIIIAVVVFAVLWFTKYESDTVPVKVTFRAEAVRNSDADSLGASWAPGARVTDGSGSATIGQVIETEITQTPVEYITPEGEVQSFPSAVFSDVTIVVRGEAHVSNNIVHISGVSVMGNDKVIIAANGYKRQTVVADVVWGEAAAE
jgi:hypothetical protein